MSRYDIGFERAYTLALQNIRPIGETCLSVQKAAGYILAEPVTARVDSPSVDASLKDGYAVFSGDLREAGPACPVNLEIVGSVAAGGCMENSLAPGHAARILTGAPLPEGADAVLAEEFAEVEGRRLTAWADAGPGRNVQPAGDDVCAGEKLAAAGEAVTPRLVGRMTAGGVPQVRVYRKPKVGLLATGSEVLLPGSPMEEGKLYASNAALQRAWLETRGMAAELRAAPDAMEAIADAVRRLHTDCDVVLTSGGAWKGDRDLVVRALESLGWEMYFHRTRMGPGKSMAAGRLGEKPVFCLPGGPASNETAFLMIALPAVLKMAGFPSAPYLNLSGRLEAEITGRSDWTQFVACDVAAVHPEPLLRPARLKRRMGAMSRAPAIVRIPEGKERIPAGARVPFLCMERRIFEWPVPAALSGEAAS
jgi:molybdopterin molybdotransferase